MNQTRRYLFVCYRSEDSGNVAPQLAQDLRFFLDSSVTFLDRDSIDLGSNWKEALAQAIAKADAMLVIIGPQWLSLHAADGVRLLDEPEDWVRREIELAFERDILVIPVLLDGAPRLAAHTFRTVPSVARLWQLQAHPLQMKRWQQDVQVLVDTLRHAGFPPGTESSKRAQSDRSAAPGTDQLKLHGDEYLATRLGSRFTTRPLFVEPTLLVRIVTASYVGSQKPLSERLRGDSPLVDWVLLARAGYLPLGLAARLATYLTRVEQFSALVDASAMANPDSERLRAAVSSMWLRLTGPERDLRAWAGGIMESDVKAFLRASGVTESSLDAAARTLFAAFLTLAVDNEASTTQMRAFAEFVLRARRLTPDESPDVVAEAYDLLSEPVTLLDRVDADLRRQHAGLTNLLELETRHSSDVTSAPSIIKQHVCRLELASRMLTLYDDVPDDALLELKSTARALCPAMSTLLIEGELGSGKTTLLSTLYGEERLVSSASAIFVSLSSLEAGFSIEDALAARERASGVRTSTSAAERTWYLDGLDELAPPERQQAVMSWMVERSRVGSRFFVSSRRSSQSLLAPIAKVVLAPLDIAKIREYVSSCPWERAGDSAAFVRLVEAEDDLRILAGTPLFLSLMVMLARIVGVANLPTRREALYDHVIRLIAGEWDALKGVNRRRVHQDRAITIAILGGAAWELYRTRRVEFNEEELANASRAWWPASLSGTPAELVDELLMDGLIVPHGDGLKFFHLSVQEFLAAQHLTRRITASDVWDAIREYQQTGWWEEVLVFYGGLIRDVSYLLNDYSYFNPATTARTGHLIRRWAAVADLTENDGLRPQGKQLLAAFMSLDGSPAHQAPTDIQTETTPPV